MQPARPLPLVSTTARRWLLLAGFLLLAAASGFAQKATPWRIYKASDGLVESFSTFITLSSRGNLWISHGDTEFISLLDGYLATPVRSPGRGNFRIFETPAGQIWAGYAEGLQEYRNGTWIRYPIPEIRAEFETNVLRQLRPLSLFPPEQDRVLFLLSDALWEFNASTRQTTAYRRSSETRIGRFLEMSSSPGGGLWISGSQGLAKVPGQIRNLRPDTAWEEFPIDDDQIFNLQRPIEDEQGGVTCVADSRAYPKRVIVLLDHGKFTASPVSGENPRQAFRAAEGGFWVNSGSAFFRWENGRKIPMEGETAAAQYFDLVNSGAGAFWLATSEGLIRYAALTWAAPPGSAAGISSPVHAMVEDVDDTLWFAQAKGLSALRSSQWLEYPFPGDLEKYFQPLDALFALRNGLLVLDAGERLLLFDPAAESFRYVRRPGATKLKPLGMLKDGRLCVAVWSSSASRSGYVLEAFDGNRFSSAGFSRPEAEIGSELFFLFAADNGDLWLGGSGGAALLHEKKWQVFGAGDGTVPESVTCIVETGSGTIWCASRDKIWEYDGKRWKMVRGGFDRINSLRRGRDGSVWVASNSGLHRFHNQIWNWNGAEDGLPSSAIYKVYEDRKGQVWAGTSRGLTRYRPDADPDPPRTFIREARGEKRAFSNGSISIAYYGTDKWKFTPSARLLYSYRLDEQEWSSYGEEQTVSFSELAAGKHHFQVRAMDRNWNVDPTPAVYEFSVILPWYEEPRLVLITLLGLAITLFFAGLAFNRHRRLVRSYAEVERIVTLRSRQLEKANEELLHSQKMTALGTLAAGVAHDFNNILSIIKGSVQIIEGSVHDPEKIKTRVNRIQTVVEQGSGIVKAMLGFSRRSAARLSLCEINSIVDETLQLLRDQFLREIEIQVECEEKLPPVPGSKELVQQILLNLIFNASDALGGKGRIVIRTGETSQIPRTMVLPPADAERHVFVVVKDFGSGIDPEVLPRIFEPSRHRPGIVHGL